MVGERTGVPRTRHFRDLLAWQKAMALAREIYLRTEEFPKSETFGLRMQLRRSAVSVASNIAEGHGRLTDPQLRNSLGMARGSLYELQTQIELACDMRFVDPESKQRLLEMAIDVAKLINGLLGVLEP
ncbi:MAG TPA: four helix bundle protein [Terracidiphilus sp.]|jgi:four helix bundle protein